MGSFSIFHWLIVLFVVVLLFGPRRLPELAKGMGEAIREFKKALNGSDGASKPQITEAPKPNATLADGKQEKSSSDQSNPGNKGS